MNTQHTPGRLEYGEDCDSQRWIAQVGSVEQIAYTVPTGPGVAEANARRLVACWNACQGLSTELLEKITTVGDTLLDRFEQREKAERELKAQRDALLTELKKVREVITAWNQAFVETATNQSTGLIDDPEDVLTAEADQDLLNGIDAAIAYTEGGAA